VKQYYKECTRCVLSNTDYPQIEFDKHGVCNICHTYDQIAAKMIFPNQKGRYQLQRLIAEIKEKGKGNKYNCIVALSGGIDSSYLVYLSKEWGLTPLVVHVDNGWNSDIAVKNIKSILNSLKLDLYTYVADWAEMKDMQLSHLKASVLDIEGPFDNMFVAALYNVAKEHKIKHILMGYNTQTEGWLPPNFVHYKLDKINLKAIQRRFGTIRIKKIPLIGPLDEWKYNRIHQINMISPLNYVDYNKEEVKNFLINTFDWVDYGYKHYENVFTRFYQGYILPRKFNIDKRKPHYSTLICSGQITRNQALEELKKDPYPHKELLEKDFQFVLKKLQITKDDFEEYMSRPINQHTDFPSMVNILNSLVTIKRRIIPRKSKFHR
jgi:N-acetyl sugar amidotransferase